MMIWLDIKDWETLQYAAGVIQDIQSRVGTGTGPIYHIGLKLGSNVVLDASKNSSFYPYGTQTLAQNLGLNELNYFWVFAGNIFIAFTSTTRLLLCRRTWWCADCGE